MASMVTVRRSGRKTRAPERLGDFVGTDPTSLGVACKGTDTKSLIIKLKVPKRRQSKSEIQTNVKRLRMSDEVGADDPTYPSNDQPSGVPSGLVLSAGLHSQPQQLTAAAPPTGIQRPPSFGRPPAWAENRYDLYATAPYFKCAQGGAYTNGGYVHGLLLDGFYIDRQYMDENIIITKLGGSQKADGKGNYEQTKSQKEHTANCLRTNKADQAAVVVIIGSNNQLCPSDPPRRYSVMGHFQVTDVWAERGSKGFTCYYVRLEKVNLGDKSWWAPEGSSPIPPQPDFSIKDVEKTCDFCHNTSVHIFIQGWICLHERCSRFFTLDGRRIHDRLDYTPEFLAKRTKYPEEIDLPILKPVLDIHSGVSDIAWHGMVCHLCGKCNPRNWWRYWECTNAECSVGRIDADLPILQASWVQDRMANGPNSGSAISPSRFDSCIKRRIVELKEYRKTIYQIDDRNTVTHFILRNNAPDKKKMADDMFVEIQKSSINLERAKMSQARVDGQLPRHFAANYGKSYKYSVATSTRDADLATCPELIQSSVQLLTGIAQNVVGEGFLPFNECLLVGYMEQQKMGYHDDGEFGLGPTIAALSLGGACEFQFRVKHKYYGAPNTVPTIDNEETDKEETDNETNKETNRAMRKKVAKAKKNKNKNDAIRKLGKIAMSPVPVGAYKAEERKALQTRHGQISPAEFASEAQKLYQSMQTEKAGNKKGDAKETDVKKDSKDKSHPELISITLRHGDMVVMNGTDLQKFYEHQASVLGNLRFALTCRYIGDDHR
ncbi:MAG: hypothetical protein M1834_009092 [Cirrosporium novae-zelandiae]|nr:MAG: hypothetical protein M1834_009092 [Cirrosporium novae-zelandiae]